MKASLRFRLDRFYSNAEEMMDGQVKVDLAYDLLKDLEKELAVPTVPADLARLAEDTKYSSEAVGATLRNRLAVGTLQAR